MGGGLTLEVALGAQVADGEPEDGEPVEFGEDAGLEGQQTGQRVQLGVEPLAVPLARIALARTLLRRRFQTAPKPNNNNNNKTKKTNDTHQFHPQ